MVGKVRGESDRWARLPLMSDEPPVTCGAALAIAVLDLRVAGAGRALCRPRRTVQPQGPGKVRL